MTGSSLGLTLKNTFVHIGDSPVKSRLVRTRSLQDLTELTDDGSVSDDGLVTFKSKVKQPEPYTPTQAQTESLSDHASPPMAPRVRRYSQPAILSLPLNPAPTVDIPAGVRLGRRSSAPACTIKQGVLGAAPPGFLPAILCPPVGGYSVPPTNGLPTTAMLRNIPSSFSLSQLMQLLATRGFSGQFDFLYLPVDFETRCSLGYAFINFHAWEDVHRFTMLFHGRALPIFPARKPCQVCLAKVQGLDANVRLFANSVSVGKLPEDLKPVVLSHGHYLPFPDAEGRVPAL